MKTKTKIWLDKNVAGLTVRLINLMVIVLGKLLRIDHNLSKPFKVIAICKYKGMGSIIQSTPLLKTLRKSYPDACIIYISSKENYEILKQIQEIDVILCINDSSILKLISSFFPFVFKLLSKKIEVYIDLEVYSNFSTLITILSKSTNRLGFYLNSMHYRLGNYTHMMYYNTHNPISETYLQFARLLNCDPMISILMHPDPGIKEIRISDSNTFDLATEKYIVINPNASDLRIERRWPESNFVRLIDLINEQYPTYKLLLIGSISEASYVSYIINQTTNKGRIISLAGKTTIPELISVIKYAFLFITNDSGPMHIGFSTKTNIIALFGPCSPKQYGHYDNCFIIYENLYCSPCIHEFVYPPCRGNNQCMTSISVDSVFKKVVAYIDKTAVSENWYDKETVYKINEFTIGTLNRKK